MNPDYQKKSHPEQLRLDLRPLREVRPEDEEQTPEGKFAAFHKANPHVGRALVHLALDWKRKGHSRGSLQMFYEVIRWEGGRTTGHPYKVNNNYRALYARLIMLRIPDLDGFFELRTLKASTEDFLKRMPL